MLAQKLGRWTNLISKIFLTLASIAVLGICGLILTMIISESRHTRHSRADIVNVNEKTKEEEKLVLGYFHHLSKTGHVLISLSPQDPANFSLGSYKGNYKRSRNILLFDSDSKNGSWLWPTNKQLVEDQTEIFDKLCRDKCDGQAIGMVFDLLSPDPKTKGEFNENSRWSSIYFELPSMKKIEIIAEADRIVGTKQINDRELVVFYSRGGSTYFKSLDTRTMMPSPEKEIGKN